MQLFGVSCFKVYVAKVHARTYGAARPVPASVASFRIKPEAAAKLNGFANDPSNVQARDLAHRSRHQSRL